MKKKQPARLDQVDEAREAQAEVAYLDRVKPRPLKTTAEEDLEAKAEIAYLDRVKPRPRRARGA